MSARNRSRTTGPPVICRDVRTVSRDDPAGAPASSARGPPPSPVEICEDAAGPPAKKTTKKDGPRPAIVGYGPYSGGMRSCEKFRYCRCGSCLGPWTSRQHPQHLSRWCIVDEHGEEHWANWHGYERVRTRLRKAAREAKGIRHQSQSAPRRNPAGTSSPRRGFE